MSDTTKEDLTTAAGILAALKKTPARDMTFEEGNNEYDGLHGSDLWREGYACALREFQARLEAANK